MVTKGNLIKRIDECEKERISAYRDLVNIRSEEKEKRRHSRRFYEAFVDVYDRTQEQLREIKHFNSSYPRDIRRYEKRREELEGLSNKIRKSIIEMMEQSESNGQVDNLNKQPRLRL